ncbi:hypothetical protein [Bifidobacterium adolescentis]|uniref:hypothetical protein n=1 Tax=Bifidobacterium adolescentis TaxID=1680 RepID=UPI001E47CDB9|nr:hypothetical protein [Bifidobacterium adolescentis]MDB1436446.1 hypothetical protein [Bifidobacterium adolescentis]MDB1438719.1 hypothetical protein [Bifidobacterium adolescentis]MDB1440412.1 hypothetical protein [Bifidobacterium adolescentis]MDB1441785.1 hypothetical protein [Bifidobacterium adolescentis]MDB1443877.1 hypothetical protein [Bifidobacterium adolescentis]
MRLEMTGSFDADGSAASSNDLLFLGFHGYSNDESGMVRIINAICATGSPDNTHHANANGNGNVNSNTNRNPRCRPTHQAQLHLIPRRIYAPIHRQPLLVSRRMLRQRAPT